MIKQEEIQETLLRLCKHYGEQNWWQSDNKIEDLVSTILIQQKSQTIKGLLIWLREVGGFEVLSKIGTEELRKQLLELKGIGPETADVLLLYLFDRPVFISDEYARRLFRRLGFGNFDTYNEMHAVYGNVLEALTLKQCQEIHAVIDEHGKAFGKSKGQLDECWLR